MKLKDVNAAMGRVTGSFPLSDSRRADCMILRNELRKLQREKLEIWQALCPACDNHRNNGAGIACILRDFRPPSMSACPLLKKAKGGKG